MAFRVKDLMIQVVANKGGGVEDPICTLATMDPDPKPEGIVPCTLATEPPTPAAIVPCTLATEPPPTPAAIVPCTLATEPNPYTAGLRAGTGQETGICTLATMFPTPIVAAVAAVTTLTPLAQAAPSNLKDLKEQLRRSLAEIERRERAQQGELPKTVEEADDLERRLEGALEELRRHRRTLEKGGKGVKKTASKAGSKAGKPKK